MGFLFRFADVALRITVRNELISFEGLLQKVLQFHHLSHRGQNRLVALLHRTHHDALQAIRLQRSPFRKRTIQPLHPVHSDFCGLLSQPFDAIRMFRRCHRHTHLCVPRTLPTALTVYFHETLRLASGHNRDDVAIVETTATVGGPQRIAFLHSQHAHCMCCFIGRQSTRRFQIRRIKQVRFFHCVIFYSAKLLIFAQKGITSALLRHFFPTFASKIRSSMDVVTVKDKQFSISIPASRLQERVAEVAQQISRDLEGKNPLFLAVLNGAFMFAADLMRGIDIPAEISFVRFASYQGMQSTGQVKQLIGLSQDIKDRIVVVIEDIIDSGLTMQQLLANLGEHQPASLHIAALLVKPENLQVPLHVDYTCFEIPNDFIVGYGLDYDGYGRNLPSIYTVMD